MSKQRKSRIKRIGILLTIVMIFTIASATSAIAHSGLKNRHKHAWQGHGTYEDRIVVKTSDKDKGKISQTEDDSTFSSGDTWHFRAEPKSGYKFVDWSFDNAGLVDLLTDADSQDLTISYKYSIPIGILFAGGAKFTATANFAPEDVQQYKLSLNVSGDGRLWKKDNLEGTYDVGTTIKLNDADPRPIYALLPNAKHIGWCLEGTSALLPTGVEVTLSSDCTYTAVFGEKFETSAGDNGSLNNDQDGYYEKGTMINLNEADPVADTGYEFDCWKESGDGWSEEYGLYNKDVTQPIITIGDSNFFKAFFKPDFSGVTVTGFSGTYDGMEHSVTVSGTLSGDTVTYSTDGVTYSSENPRFINATSVMVYVKVERGGEAYDDSATVNIAKATLTVTADDKIATYGDPAPAYTASYSGFKGTDDESVLSGAPSLTCPYVQGDGAGSYTITVAQDTLDATNYSFSFVDGTLTVDKAILMVTADDKTVTYGDAAPTYTASYSGFKGTDDESVLSGAPSFTCPYVQGNGAGSYTITAAQDTLDATNYSFSFVNGTLTVDKAILTVTADDKTVTYGDAAPTYIASYSGFKGTDDESVLSGAPMLTCSYSQWDSAGPYTITAAQGTLCAANYDFLFNNGTLYVSKVTLTVTADNKTVTFGDPAPVYTASYSGFIGSDDESVLTGTLVFDCAYVAGLPASGNPYIITPSGLRSGVYYIIYVPGELTVSIPVVRGLRGNTSPTPSPSPSPSATPEPTPTPTPEVIEDETPPAGSPSPSGEGLGDDDVPAGGANVKGGGSIFASWWFWLLAAGGAVGLLLFLLWIFGKKGKAGMQH